MSDLNSLVRPLALAGLTLAEAGGKGLNLGVMLRAGLPVPDGVLVTTAAYRAFVTENGLDAVIARAWEEAVSGAAAGFERASVDVLAAFEAGCTSSTVADAVGAALPDGAVAVRSSATAEDLPDASFAGQQDTYLNVRGRGG